MTSLPVVLKNGYGAGGRGLGTTPTARHRPIGEVMQAVQLDLAAGRPDLIAAADAPTQSGSYVQGDVQALADLANELKAALNKIAGTLAGPALPAGNNATYDLAGGTSITIAVDGLNRTFTFADTDFAAPAAATAAEVAAAINSRNGLAQWGVEASVTAGPAVTLTGGAGGDKTLLAVAGGAEAEFDFLAAGTVAGTGLALNLQRVDA